VSTGGLGGGASGGSYYQSINAGIPTVNTGSGGGGNYGDATRTISAGASGVVILRYPDAFPLATATTGSPTVTNPTGYRIYTFTASGSITF
jgi:hypothetical protein